MNEIKIIPNGIPEAGLGGTRVLIVGDWGERDISHLVTAVSWSHRAGDLPVCTLELFCQQGDGVVPETMGVRAELVSAHIGPSPDWPAEARDVALLIKGARQRAFRKLIETEG